MVLDLEGQRRTEALKLDGGRAAAWRRPVGERPLSTDLFKTGLVRTRQAHQEVACSFRFCRRQRRRAASIVMALEQGVGVERRRSCIILTAQEDDEKAVQLLALCRTDGLHDLGGRRPICPRAVSDDEQTFFFLKRWHSVRNYFQK